MLRVGQSTDIEKLIYLWSSLDNYVADTTNNYVLKSKESNYLDEVNKFIGDILASNNSIIFVKEINNEIIGFVTAHIEKLPWFTPTTGLIGSIYVEEKHRENGVGKLLLNSAEKWLDSNGVFNIQVCWHSQNHEANRFWQNNGYSVSQMRGTKNQ